jgi:enediyne biosynthesis protein E4
MTDEKIQKDQLALNKIVLISILGVIGFSFFGCNEKTQSVPEKLITEPIFTLLSPDSTQIHFTNALVENPQINYFKNPYIYNGGGVSVGDVNNDGLPDLYFSSNIYSNKLYINKGNLKFEDISKSAGVEASRGFKTGVAMVDINNDGWLDIYVCRSHHKDATVRSDFVYLNNHDLTFEEKSMGLGLFDGAYTSHVTFLDYDNDGDLDVYQINHPEDFDQGIRVRLKMGKDRKLTRRLDPESLDHSDHLYRNDGTGKFTDVSKSAGIENSAFGLSASLIDVNNDGFTDIYVANDFIEPDMLYVNNGNGTFTDRITEYFRHTSQNSMGSDFADFNNDGLDDLMTLDMLAEGNERQKLLTTSMVLDRYETLHQYGYGHQLMRNMLQINNGNGSFSEIGLLAGVAATDWSWSSLFADFDNDGHKDIFISNGIRRDMTDSDYIQFKRDTIEKSQQKGDPYVTPQSLQKWLDRMPSVKVHNYMYRNKTGLQFEDVSLAWGFDLKTFTNGTVYSDLDRDGDLDLVLNDIDSKVLVYRNESNTKSKNHFLQFTFKGSDKNKFGVGAKVTVFTNGILQYQEVKISRGFLSSVESLLHFGLGENEKADSVLVKWPDGKEERLLNVKANQLLQVDYTNAKIKLLKKKQSNTVFKSTTLVGLDFTHRENKFNDFEKERLLPHKFSQAGPCVAVADVNNDGTDDVFIGGAAGQAGALYTQTLGGEFNRVAIPSFETDSAYEDTGATFFDADADGDQDLYVVSGGYEFGESGSGYQNRLYMNDGFGKFEHQPNRLPKIEFSGSCVLPCDFDRDGDIDLFVGGRVIPGRYPENPRSYLLQNNTGIFKDVTHTISPQLENIGLVTSGKWFDHDKDGYDDLVIIGEWMPITLFKNLKGKGFEDINQSSGLDQSNGWWNAIEVFDADGDGDYDFVAGNMGLNSALRASPEKPLEIYADDFDNNGSLDAVICSYVGEKSWPLPRKELMVQQIPSLKKKFVQFEKYSRSTIADMFSAEQLAQAIHKKAYILSTSLWLNTNGVFKQIDLPIEAQFAPVNAISITDVNADGNQDILLVGNDYGTQVELGRYDAFNGLVLTGNGKGKFFSLPVTKSGFYTPHQARDLQEITVNKKLFWIVGNTNATLQFFTLHTSLKNNER